MESRTKTTLSRSQLDSLCRLAFGSGAEPRSVRELTDGMFNSSWSIDLAGRNRTVVLKVAPPPDISVLSYEREIMKAEVEIYRILRERVDVPCPEVLFSDFTRSVIPMDYFFMTCLTGTPLNKIRRRIPRKNLQDIHRDLGRYTARIHSIKGDAFGYPADRGRPHTSDWRSSYFDMVHRILEDGRAAGCRLPVREERILALLEAASPCLEEVTEPVLTHFDLWEGNIFVREYGGIWEIEGLIDCERAFWGDPHGDFVTNIALFGDIRKKRHFLEGYRDQAGRDVLFSPSLLCRLSLYRIYLYLIMLVEPAYREVDGSYGFQKRLARAVLKREVRKLRRMVSRA